MTLTNKECISRGFDAFATGLFPVLDEAMKTRSPMGGNWVDEYPEENLQTDVITQINVFKDHRAHIFRYVFNRDETNWLTEVFNWKNNVLRGNHVSADDVYRALDTMERVLARHAASVSGELLVMKQNLLRERAADEARRAKPKTGTLFASDASGLKPWREVIQPHPDVAGGRFSAAEFAADLFNVHHSQGASEYTDPMQFFNRTYVTEGLEGLLRQAVRRIKGDTGAPPIIDLQTTFGGGKTHSMISLYHLFSGVDVNEFPQEIQDLLHSENVNALPAVGRAVVVGGRFSPVLAEQKPDGCEVGTIWGEIAWQLGGKAAFDSIADADVNPGNPGDHLRPVIEAAAPCVILIDEWVAYAAQLLGERNMRGGGFDTQFYFAQTLTEIVKSVPGALLVVALPAAVDDDGAETQTQVSGQQGHEALRKLRDVVGRTKTPWYPASAEEGFEIVRRRLFQDPDPENLKHIKATAKAFSEFYKKNSSEFPPEAKEREYARKLERSYPIHPELFTRLYDDWSTLERFQRTRGILRLMAQVIHALWAGDDRSPMIMPGLLPIDDSVVSAELMSNLSEAWPPIIHKDVDGDESTPRRLERKFPNLGKHAAARRIARTILLGSAPSVNTANQGIEVQRVRLGAVLPGEKVVVFNDALDKLVAEATYLYHEGTRYWYGTQAHIGQLARDRSEQIRTERQDLLKDEIQSRLSKHCQARGFFSAVHVMPANSGEVDDRDEARLVVLSTKAGHHGRGESVATQAAQEILEQRGTSPRVYRNMLVFLAANQRQVDTLNQAAADYLAWSQINTEKVNPLNLDPRNQKQVDERLAEATNKLDAALRNAYKSALVPVQPDATGPIKFETVKCDGAGGLAERCFIKLGEQGMLSTNYSSEMIRQHLDSSITSVWKDGHCKIADLWEVLARYTYLPRLTRVGSLIDVLSTGAAKTTWNPHTWALAASVNADGRYVDLIGGAATLSMNGTWLVVKPELAAAQLKAEVPEEVADKPTVVDFDDAKKSGSGGSGGTPGASAPIRFYGVKGLEPVAARIGRDFEQVNDEVIAQLLRVFGAQVTVKIDIEVACPKGFDEQTVRNIKANADTLKFDDFGFE